MILSQPVLLPVLAASPRGNIPRQGRFRYAVPRPGELQFVFGSRFSRIGSTIVRYQHRHYLGRVMATFVSLYLGIPVYDTQCGAKFFYVDFVQKVFVDPFVSRWLFDVEIFRRIILMGIDVRECAYELPLKVWIEKGDSRISFVDYCRLPFEFGRLIHHYARKKRQAARKSGASLIGTQQ